jgi:CPA1 family monovalent cation:H+ antiporter
MQLTGSNNALDHKYLNPQFSYLENPFSRSMDLYYTFSILIVLSALFSFVNSRFLKLPPAIGIMLLAIVTSIILIALDRLNPAFSQYFSGLITRVDFPSVLMGAMLNFLLFAGAIHVSMQDLHKQRLPILILSTVGVILSTFIVGALDARFIDTARDRSAFIQCLVFEPHFTNGSVGGNRRL